jgi:uncharacterized protein
MSNVFMQNQSRLFFLCHPGFKSNAHFTGMKSRSPLSALTYYEHMLIMAPWREIMPRPKCCRQIGFMPGKTCFQPEGATSSSFEAVFLTLDEYEALRLADLEGLYQEKAASRMNISRQTFGRIIEAARRKVADVLVNGKVLKIEGGSVSMNQERPVRCPRCRRAMSSDCSDRHEMSCPHCRVHAKNQTVLKGRI